MTIEDKIMQISGTAIPLPGDNVDTDRITPADSMKQLTYARMPDFLYRDEKRNPEHPLNNPDYEGASIMIVGANYGIGSSRETAPQAIKRYGINALVGVSFAEIFAGNCNVLGVPAVSVSPEDVAMLMDLTQREPQTMYTLDLQAKTLSFDGGQVNIDINEARRNALVTGRWNPLAMLKANQPQVEELAGRLPYMTGFPGH